MRIVFTCACGNVAKIDAESLERANMIVTVSRWILVTDYMRLTFIDAIMALQELGYSSEVAEAIIDECKPG